tara:strand:+ start:252 stop:362 length:111 start_codon:yes stop_codon:yes gene_type:complete
VHWITGDHDYRAHGLYNKLAKQVDLVLYKMKEMPAK